MPARKSNPITSQGHTTARSPRLRVRRSPSSISFGSTRLPRGSLTPSQRELLAALSTGEPIPFMDSPEFHKPGAQKRIFNDAPSIEKPDVSWYQRLLDERSASSQRAFNPRPPKSLVLTAAQERVIFGQFNYARFRLAREQRRGAKLGVTPLRSRSMLRWHATAEELRSQIAETNLALVLAMAKRVRSAELDFGDLISEGNMALMRSIDKFDYTRGFKFSTYACRAILKAFSRLGTKTLRHKKLFPIEFDPLLERGDYPGEVRALRESESVQDVKAIFANNRAALSEIERTVLFHRYGLDRPIREAPLTLEQVGSIVGVTKERVRQIQNKALEKIRVAMVSLDPIVGRVPPSIGALPN